MWKKIGAGFLVCGSENLGSQKNEMVKSPQKQLESYLSFKGASKASDFDDRAVELAKEFWHVPTVSRKQ